jgi:hypothetical protein
MRVKVSQGTIVHEGGNTYVAGQEAEVSDDLGAALVKGGSAVSIEPQSEQEEA